jgi:hypothetical protein
MVVATSQHYSPPLWKLYNPTIGKFRRTLRSLSLSNTEGDPVQISGSRVGKKGRPVQKTGRRLTLPFVGVAFSTVTTTSAFAQPGTHSRQRAPTTKRYLREYTAPGDLVLLTNFNEWVFVGSSLAPNALNGGKANFPAAACRARTISQSEYLLHFDIAIDHVAAV